MSMITSSTMHDCSVSSHGNISLAIAELTLSPTAENDVVEILHIPKGLKLVGFRIMTSGLGVDVKLDLKVGDTLLAAGIDAAEVCELVKPLIPVTLEHSETLTVTIKGGVATGKLTVMPEYIADGY